MVALDRKFEFTARTIEFTRSLYSILDGSTICIFEYTSSSCHLILNMAFTPIYIRYYMADKPVCSNIWIVKLDKFEYTWVTSNLHDEI